jgi:hypothetical protein
MSLLLKYISGGTTYSKYFDSIFEKGFNDGEDFEFFPVSQSELADGVIDTRSIGFRRIFTIKFNPADMDATSMTFIARFLLGGLNPMDQYVDNGNGEGDIAVAIENPQSQSIEFIEDWKDGKDVTLRLKEKNIRTDWPSAMTLYTLIMNNDTGTTRTILTSANYASHQIWKVYVSNDYMGGCMIAEYLVGITDSTHMDIAEISDPNTQFGLTLVATNLVLANTNAGNVYWTLVRVR